MKRFVFRLESVLKIRDFELERARIELTHLEQERLRRQVAVSAAQEMLEVGRRLLAQEGQQGADGELLALRADGVTVGRMHLRRVEEELMEGEPALLLARKKVSEAGVRVRSLERLRDRQSEAYRHESMAEEQKELEELAMARIARRTAYGRRVEEEIWK